MFSKLNSKEEKLVVQKTAEIMRHDCCNMATVSGMNRTLDLVASIYILEKKMWGLRKETGLTDITHKSVYKYYKKFSTRMHKWLPIFNVKYDKFIAKNGVKVCVCSYHTGENIIIGFSDEELEELEV